MSCEFAANTKQHEAVARAIDALRHGDEDTYKETVTEKDGDQFSVVACWSEGLLQISIDCIVAGK
ncbi:MAG: hypothetical protein ACUZ8A_06610 [Candidatus Bathyanammoxibius sp.]